MTVIRRWSGDGLSDGPLTIGAAGLGDNGFTNVVGGPVIESSGIRSPRIRLSSSAGASRVHWWPLGSVALSEYSLRLYIEFSQYPASGDETVFTFLQSGSDRWSLRVASSGVLRLRDDGAGVVRWNSGAPMPLGTLMRIEVVVEGGEAAIYAYDGETMSVLATTAEQAITGPIDELRVGRNIGGSVAFAIDDIALSDEPVIIGAVDPEEAPPPEVIMQWKGDGLVAGPLTTSSAGPGDKPFSSVMGGVTIEQVGARGPRIRLPDSSEVKRVHWWPLHSEPLTRYAMRWYQTFDGYPAGVSLVNGLIGGGADKWSVRITAAGVVRLRDDVAAVFIGSQSAALPTGQLIRFELVVDEVGSVFLGVYRGHTDTALGVVSGTLTDPAIDELRFGPMAASLTSATTYDDIVFQSNPAAIGPAAEPGQIHTHYRFDGSAWVPQDVLFL